MTREELFNHINQLEQRWTGERMLTKLAALKTFVEANPTLTVSSGPYCVRAWVAMRADGVDGSIIISAKIIKGVAWVNYDCSGGTIGSLMPPATRFRHVEVAKADISQAPF